MKVLVDINHPAHVHFFKYMIEYFKNNGYEVVVTASEKDVAFELLKYYNIPFINIGSYGKGFVRKVLNMPKLNLRMLKIINRTNPDYLLGISSFRIAQCGFLRGKKSFIFDDTEHATEQIRLFQPFATKIFTPDCFYHDLGKRQIRYPGYHELSYLHPDRFKPDPAILAEAGLTEQDKYFIVRFVSWEASHDIGQKGLSPAGRRKLVDILKSQGRVIISAERELPSEFEPYRMSIHPAKMHHLMYYANLYIGEGGTMASEAAVLGTHSIYINSIEAMGYIQDEINAGLIFKSTDETEIFSKLDEFLKNENIKSDARSHRSDLLKSKVDVTSWFIDWFNNSEYKKA